MRCPGRLNCANRLDGDLFSKGGVGLVLFNEVVAHHQIQHSALAAFSGLQVVLRVQRGGLLGNTRNQRRLGQRQISGRLAEIGLRRLLRAIGALTKVDQVEVHLQDFLFGIEGCQILGNQHLEDFAVNRLVIAPLGREEEIARELHRNCARARHHITVGGVLNERSDDTARINSLVLKEGGVFRGNCGIDHVGRNAAEGHPSAPPLVHQLGQHCAMAVAHNRMLEDARQRAGLIAAQIGFGDLQRRVPLARAQLKLGVVARKIVINLRGQVFHFCNYVGHGLGQDIRILPILVTTGREREDHADEQQQQQRPAARLARGRARRDSARDRGDLERRSGEGHRIHGRRWVRNRCTQRENVQYCRLRAYAQLPGARYVLRAIAQPQAARARSVHGMIPAL